MMETADFSFTADDVFEAAFQLEALAADLRQLGLPGPISVTLILATEKDAVVIPFPSEVRDATLEENPNAA